MSTLHSNLYGILNVPVDASQDQIKSSYKKMVMNFHPDRVQVKELKHLAEEQFNEIQRAFEILSNENSRMLYDKFGEVDSFWDLSFPISKDKLLHEFEKRAEIEKEISSMKKLTSTGQIALGIDATPLFRRKLHWVDIWNRECFPEIADLHVIQTWQTQCTDTTKMRITADVLTLDGLGDSSLALSTHYYGTDDISIDTTGSFGAETFILLSIAKIYENGLLGVALKSASLSLIPTTTFSCARNLSENLSGFLSYTPDFNHQGKLSSCTIGVKFVDKNYTTGIDLVAARKACQVTLKQIVQYQKVRGKASASIGNMGFVLSLGGTTAVNQSTFFGINVEIKAGLGVCLNLKLSRLGHKLQVPILLSEELDISFGIMALCVPLLGYNILDRFILKARRKKNKAQYLEKIRRDNQEILEARKKEALQAVVLLSDTIAKRLESEGKDGLIILNAMYGKLPISDFESPLLSPAGLESFSSKLQAKFEDSPISSLSYIDVTIPIQALVHQSALEISNQFPKSDLVGFYDPCFGEKKKLRVMYQFKGKLHQVTVGDCEALVIPKRGTSHFYFRAFISKILSDLILMEYEGRSGCSCVLL